MIATALLLSLVLPAGAEIFSRDPENQWNLLRVLPRREREGAASPSSAEAALDAAETAAVDGRDEDAVGAYRRYLELCRGDAPCASLMDRARAGLGMILGRHALPEDRDDAVAREALSWLESVESERVRRSEAIVAERGRLRAILGRKHLLVAEFYARRGKWDAAAARVEAFAAEYPDVFEDADARRYLKEVAARADRERGELARRARELAASPAVETFAAVAARPAAAAAAFDGAAGAASAEPSVRVHVELRDGQPRALTVSGEEWSVEVGQLGLAGRTATLKESPYINLRRVTRSPLEAAVDKRVEIQGGVVDMTARFFGDDSALLQARRLADRIGQGFAMLGIPDAAKAASDVLTYSDPWRSEAQVMLGGMVQYGRAFPVPFRSPLPIDLAWSATALVKSAYLAPNVAANLTAGARFGLPGGYDAAAFAGWSENASPIDNRLLSNLVRQNDIRPGFYHESSPQAALMISGPVRGVPGGRVEVGYLQRWNADTNVQEAQAGVSGQVIGRDVRFRVGYKRERGDRIEYDRKGARVEASVSVVSGHEAFGQCEKETISYGGVGLENDGCLLGWRWTPGGGASAEAAWLLGGRDRIAASGTRARALAEALNEFAAVALETADALVARGEAELSSARVAGAVAALPTPELSAALDAIAAAPIDHKSKGIIAGLLVTAAGDSGPRSTEVRDLVRAKLGEYDVASLRADYARYREMARQAAVFLADAALWEGVAQTLMRREMLAAIADLDIKLGPLGNLRITPISAIFMANVINSRGSPFAPVTQADARALERGVMAAVSGALGAKGSTPEAVVAAVIERSRVEASRRVESELIPRMDAALADPQATAERLLELVPADTAADLRARLGADLGLSQVDPVKARELLRSLPGVIAQELHARVAPAAAAALREALALASEAVRREINRTVLQLLMAAEELDRISVDRGLKPGDLGLRMAGESLARLDARRRARLEERRRATIASFVQDLEEQGRSLAATAAERVEGVLGGAAEQAGALVRLEERSRARLVQIFGEDLLREKLRELSRRLPPGTRVEVVFDPVIPNGTMLSRTGDGEVRLSLGVPGRSPENMLDAAIETAAAVDRRIK